MSGYHKNIIKKGKIGELSKVFEEVEEVKDSQEQGVNLMVLVELSDVIGAIEMYLEKHHKSITIEDLIKMKNRTRNAFQEGSRV